VDTANGVTSVISRSTTGLLILAAMVVVRRARARLATAG
jgi:hypothetical protein